MFGTMGRQLDNGTPERRQPLGQMFAWLFLLLLFIQSGFASSNYLHFEEWELIIVLFPSLIAVFGKTTTIRRAVVLETCVSGQS